MITSSPYNPRTRERLTRTEAIDGAATPPCHTIAPLFGSVLLEVAA